MLHLHRDTPRTSQDHGLRPLALALCVALSTAAWGAPLARNLAADSVAPADQTATSVSSTTPALTLPMLLDAASATYPGLRAARLEARASAQDVEAVERQRWPTISATLESYTGNLRSTPSRGVQVEQTLWDAGRITARISEARTLEDISTIKVYLQQQDLFLQIVSAWQNLQGANERIRVAQQTLQRLRDYQAQMRRRVEAQASPRIDLELADARLLQTEVEMASAQSALKVALTRLEQLCGLEGLSRRLPGLAPLPSLDATQGFEEQLQTTDWLSVVSQHPVVAKARAEVQQTRHRLDGKKAENLPQVFVRSYQPIGSIPSSSDTSMTTFIGMRYSPGAGFSSFAETQALATRIASTEQGVETAMREMEQTLRNDREDFSNARIRIAAIEKSVSGSDLVLESYQRQFQAGRKSWQDLLNAVRELAQNQYALADARATMLGALHRIQIRTGQDPLTTLAHPPSQ